MNPQLTYNDFVAQAQGQIEEVMPHDLPELFAGEFKGLVIDVREESEYAFCHILGSHLVPRGILEAAADKGYEESLPELIQAREKKVLLVCRSGRRSLLAGVVLKQMGFMRLLSLKTGLRGAMDTGFPLFNAQGEVPEAELERFFYPHHPAESASSAKK